MGNVMSLNFNNTGMLGLLTPSFDKDGYYRVTLSNGNKKKTCRVHRLVAEAFIPNPNNLPEVNHKSEVKTENSASNLEWCDTTYNINYGSRNERVRESLSKPVVCVETGQVY